MILFPPMAQVVILSDVVMKKDEIRYGRSIGPYVLASKARRAGFSCAVVDFFTDLANLDSVLESHLGPETLFVGISSSFLSVDEDNPKNITLGVRDYYGGFLWLETLPDLRSFVANIRSHFKRAGILETAKLGIGGTKALYALQRPDMRTLFDYYFIGKAESYFVSFLNCIRDGIDIPQGTYEGSAFLHEGVYQAKTEEIEEILWQKEDVILAGESLPIEIAKGCLYSCKFCNFEKAGSIRQTTDALKNTLTRNYEMFGTQIYTFMDDCFNDTRAKVEEVCNAIQSLPFKIEWVSYARVDVACKFPHTLEAMIESGCRGLFWGIETFNHEIGKRIGKGTPPDQVKDLLLKIRDSYSDRVVSMGSFILGLPGETEDSIERTHQWIVESQALDILYFPVLSVRPYSERLDKAVIDYADFARNPKKYGFQEISFDPVSYWKHETMTSERAQEIRLDWIKRFKALNGWDGFIRSIFQIPHVRSLGFSMTEIIDFVNNGHWGDAGHLEIMRRQSAAKANYQRAIFATGKAEAGDFGNPLR